MEQELSAEQMLESVRADAAPKVEEPAQAPETPAQSPFDPEKIEYDWNGKKIVENLEMVRKRASMGYDYAQKMAALNQERDKYKGYDTKIQQLERWQQYNDFAEKNPEWARHVEEAWNSRQNNAQLTQEQSPIDPRIQTLEQKLAEIESFKNEWSEARQAEQVKAEDTQFSQEIEQTAKKLGVDFSQSDEQGRTLEWRTLEMMKEMGLDGSKPGHFEMAFKHMYFDNLVGKSKDQAKEQEARQALEARKVGILGVSRTPQAQSQSKAFNPSRHSWEDATKFAMADLEASRKA